MVTLMCTPEPRPGTDTMERVSTVWSCLTVVPRLSTILLTSTSSTMLMSSTRERSALTSHSPSTPRILTILLLPPTMPLLLLLTMLLPLLLIMPLLSTHQFLTWLMLLLSTHLLLTLLMPQLLMLLLSTHLLLTLLMPLLPCPCCPCPQSSLPMWPLHSSTMDRLLLTWHLFIYLLTTS